MKDGLIMETNRVVHTHDDLEPFMFDGKTYRKRVDSYFEWWTVDVAALMVAQQQYCVSEHDRRERQEEYYSANMVAYKAKSFWARLWITEPRLSTYFYMEYNQNMPEPKDYRTWQPVTSGPYYKEDI